MGKRFAIAVVRRARGLVSGGLVLSLAFLGAFAAPAGATFDGENDPIAFSPASPTPTSIALRSSRSHQGTGTRTAVDAAGGTQLVSRLLP